MTPIRALLGLAALATAFAGAPAWAQVVTSPGPDSVAVTIYRAPYHPPNQPLPLGDLQGYALITEKRTIDVPAGRATIRFEGVAAGVLPESAIVTGLPQGVREKNLDAELLSPANLYARSFGRPVTIRHTVAGKVTEERAIIRSAPDGAAILQTSEGFIAVNCGQRRDEIVYDSVPAGLSAKPTLSIETEAPQAAKVTVTLSYLAWGFDWQANYVATMRPDGKGADLLAWVTLANDDVTGFTDAEAMVVAGNIRREDYRQDSPPTPSFVFHCFAIPISAYPDRSVTDALQRVPGVAMNRFAGKADADDDSAIVVTGALVQQENLGDLKLYRVPHRTTVAAMSQKQVAMIDRQSVPVQIFYRVRIYDDDIEDDTPMIVLRAQNRKEDGLGIPLPSGSVSVFAPWRESRVLVGEGRILDKAVNEEVEVETGEATQVTAELEDADSGSNWEEHVLTVRNANPWPIHFEAEMATGDDYKRTRASARLGRKHGRDLWAAEVPANGTATFKYRLKDVD